MSALFSKWFFLERNMKAKLLQPYTYLNLLSRKYRKFLITIRNNG